MDRIIIVSEGPEVGPPFTELLAALFPDCLVICIQARDAADRGQSKEAIG